MTREILAPWLSGPLPDPGTVRRAEDVEARSARRVHVAGLAFAAVWAWVLIMNLLPWRLAGASPSLHGPWPWPGFGLTAAGILLSLGMAGLARRFRDRPDALLRAGLGYEVITALLIAAISWWEPFGGFGLGVSWVCVVILVYPAIVPATPSRTLAAALAAAAMDPLLYAIGRARGIEYGLDAYLLAFAFVPNFICAGLATVPAAVIRGLSRRVSRERELGSYRLGEVLAQGGMGELHLATHRLLARPAAIKLIRPAVLETEGPERAQVIRERFRREARAVASLRSPHTIELYDFGTAEDGSFYYVMELLNGLDLRELVDRFGPLPPARVVHFLEQACLSLAEAHGRGLVHRDVKPANLFACRMGVSVDVLKVLDFGLVKAEPDLLSRSPDLTSPMAMAGTPAYMAPEMAVGEGPVDRRVDIYALGCVAFRLLTGRDVFVGDTALSVLTQHVRDEPPAPSTLVETPLPAELERIVLDCLRKDPPARPGTAMELRERLESCPLPARWSARDALAWWRLHLPDRMEDRPPPLDEPERGVGGSPAATPTRRPRTERSRGS